MNQTLIISLVLIAVFAVVFLYAYLRSIRAHVLAEWSNVLEKLGVRLDKIPNLIETMKRFGKGEDPVVGKLMALRPKAWAITKVEPKRVHVELEVTARLREVWKMAGGVEGLSKDTNFLALRSGFKEVANEIEEVSQVFNMQVRRFNKVRMFPLFAPFSVLMGFKKMPVFEFEGS